MEARGFPEDALRVATDPDYRFDLAVQLGHLQIAQVSRWASRGDGRGWGGMGWDGMGWWVGVWVGWQSGL